MKLSSSAFSKICRSPLTSLNSILFHGSTDFCIQMKIDQFLNNNPTLTSHQKKRGSQDALLKNKVSLLDLLKTDDLFNRDPEVFIITNSTDKIVPLVEDVLKEESDLFFIIKSQDYLKPSSKLRKLYESNDSLACMPCYELSLSDFEREIGSFFTHHHKEISSELRRNLASFFHTSPDTMKEELNKILTYVGLNKVISMSDIKDVISSLKTAESNDLIYSFLDKNKKKTSRALQSLDKTISPISIMRSLASSLERLYQVKRAINTGSTLEQGIKTLLPPLFFSDQALFKKRASLWSQEELEVSLKKLLDLEVSIKENSRLSKEIFEFNFLSMIP